MPVSTRRNALVLLFTLAASSVAATVAWAHSTPQIRAQQAHERQVLAQVAQIGRNLQTAQDQAWNAQQRLNQVKQSLRENELRLHVAKANLHGAQKRVMDRLYSLYVNGSPSMIDVIAGAHSVSQMIDRAESAQVLSNQDASLGRQALSYEHSVQQRQRRLKQLEGQRERAVAERKAKLHEVQSELAQQKRLLASIHTTIRQLQQQEAEREQRARAAAEARLQAQLAAAAAARAAAAQASQSRPSTGVVSPPVSIPIGDPGVGHPQAASIALHYLGVPYVWGGSSPSGFDCSGLVMYVYAQLGISLPHYTVAQWNATLPVSQSQMQPGDLVFFDGLGHVGIYIGSGQFVDAPHTGAVVRIDNLSGYSGFDGARRVP
jgi:cell wall-associated NlpC family hydrolase